MRLPSTAAFAIVLPLPPFRLKMTFPLTLVAPQLPRCHGEPEALPCTMRFPSIVELQMTFAPELIASDAAEVLSACTLPLIVEPASRTPALWRRRTLPLTVTRTRSHQAPLGTVRFPSMVVAFSCSSEQVMFEEPPPSVACRGRFAIASASPTECAARGVEYPLLLCVGPVGELR